MFPEGSEKLVIVWGFVGDSIVDVRDSETFVRSKKDLLRGGHASIGHSLARSVISNQKI